MTRIRTAGKIAKARRLGIMKRSQGKSGLGEEKKRRKLRKNSEESASAVENAKFSSIITGMLARCVVGVPLNFFVLSERFSA